MRRSYLARFTQTAGFWEVIMNIEQIKPIDTLPLRQEILRPNSLPSECIYEGDEDNSTVHFGAIYGGSIVGILSMYHRSYTDLSGSDVFQLRAMATALSIRGQGAGFKLLKEAEAHAKDKGGKYLWANARSVAIEFYRKSGYSISPIKFEIEGVGSHYLIRKCVA